MNWPTTFVFKARPPENKYDAQATKELEALLGSKMPSKEVYVISPLCQMVPRPTDEEFQRLKASIAAEGLIDPVIVLDDDNGQVLDGWSRLRAVHELGLGIEKLKALPLASLPHMKMDTFKGRQREFVLLASERRGLTVMARIELAKQMFKAQGKRRATQQEEVLIAKNSPKAPQGPEREAIYTRRDVMRLANVKNTGDVSRQLKGGETLELALQQAVDQFKREGRTYNAAESKKAAGNATPETRAAVLAKHFTAAELAARASCSGSAARAFLLSKLEKRSTRSVRKTPSEKPKITPTERAVAAWLKKHGNIDAVRAMRAACDKWIKENA